LLKIAVSRPLQPAGAALAAIRGDGTARHAQAIDRLR
jgi:hypothetical protein